MHNPIPRRSFLLAWVGSLLAGLLGQASVAATPPLRQRLDELAPIQELYVFAIDPPGRQTLSVYDANGDLIWRDEIHGR